MAQPLVMGDKITGQCPGHMIPSASGTAPAGPLPFSAPLTDGLESKVTIGGKPVAVLGASGLNFPPHPGLADAFTAPNTQKGMVLSGSPTVTAGGKPIATSSSQCSMCMQVPGQPVSSVTNVTVA
jgi:uncharacterized Zn-binding protein involved in type VI secretion